MPLDYRHRERRPSGRPDAVPRDRSPSPRRPFLQVGWVSCDSGVYPRTLPDVLFWYLPRKLWSIARWRLFRWRTAFRLAPWRKPVLVEAEFEEEGEAP